MKVDFEGVKKNADRNLRHLVRLAKSSKSLDEDDSSAHQIDFCLSIYYDTILGLCQGRISVEEAKEFWFSNEDMSAIKYDGRFVKFRDEISEV